jgi:cardiolipin synthase (CMP-forming)
MEPSRTTGADSSGSSSRVLTVPNVISIVRIALIPVFALRIVDHETSAAGILLFSFVVATDWVDGLIARRTGQVSELGKVLDPVADRLAIAAGLVALAVRGAFPWWAAGLILARDVMILTAGAFVLLRHHVRLEVRWIGKIATFTLMTAIPWVSWGTLGLPLGEATLVAGWVAFAVGIVEYYVAAIVYARDIRLATAHR